MSETIKLPPIPPEWQGLWNNGGRPQYQRDHMEAYARLAVEQNTEALRAERDALQADAERYRWLRECARATSEHWGGRWSLVIEGPAPGNAMPAGIDAAIEAARAALKEASDADA